MSKRKKTNGFVNFEELKKFIGLVKEQPALYDPAAKFDSTPQSTALIWAEIAGTMGYSYMQAADWKCKWKCLRDTLVKKKKDVRLAESQGDVERATQWRFFHHMSFLDPFIDRGGGYKTILKNNDSTISNDGHYTIVKREDYTEGETSEEEGDEQGYSRRKRDSDEALNLNANTSKRRRQSKIDKISTEEFDEEQMNIYHEDESSDSQLNNRSNALEMSNSRNFFMSCAIRMDKLPERVQSYLQLQVSQLFFNAENPDVSSVPIMPLPSCLNSVSSNSGLFYLYNVRFV